MHTKRGQSLEKLLAEEFSEKAAKASRDRQSQPRSTYENRQNRSMPAREDRQNRHAPAAPPIEDRKELFELLGPLADQLGLKVSSVNGGKGKKRERK